MGGVLSPRMGREGKRGNEGRERSGEFRHSFRTIVKTKLTIDFRGKARIG